MQLLPKKQLKNKDKAHFVLVCDEIFGNDVLVSVSTLEELVSHVKSELRYSLSEREEEALEMKGNGRCVQLKNKAIIIRLAREDTRIGIDIPTLTHEIAHAAFYKLDGKGIKHVDESDEVYAYFQGFLMRKVLDYFDK